MHHKQTLGEGCGTWVVEYWTQLRRSEHQVALEWAGQPENGSSSAHDGGESAVDDQELGRAGKTSAGWERVYRGRRSECVTGSLAQGKTCRHGSISFRFGGLSCPYLFSLRWCARNIYHEVTHCATACERPGCVTDFRWPMLDSNQLSTGTTAEAVLSIAHKVDEKRVRQPRN